MGKRLIYGLVVVMVAFGFAGSLGLLIGIAIAVAFLVAGWDKTDKR